MNIIFLDIDGVLNSIEYVTETYNALKRTLKREEMFDPVCMKNLKQIVDKTDAKIVITSSWKIGDMELLHEVFSKYGINIFDKTKHYGDRRGKEIRDWMAEHQEAKKFIIIDDDYFKDYPGLDDHIVHTSIYSGRGLNEKHVEQALRLFEEAN